VTDLLRLEMDKARSRITETLYDIGGTKMNGQLYNLLNISNYLNSVVHNDPLANFENEKYTNSISFIIEKKKGIIDNFQKDSNLMVKIGLEEFELYLQKKSCRNVIVNLSINADDINKSAFANGITGQVMVCQFKSSYEVWRNHFDYNGESWDVCYSYVGLYNGIYNATVRNIESELRKLSECYQILNEFALEIDEDYWANFFKDGKEKIDKINGNVDLKNLMPNIMSPFGGMGSWNDSPPYSAHIKGLDEEYKRYSDNLYKQLHMVLESVCNRCSTNVV